jgi:glycosyltransferase involved in cell wall biosynthesis
VIRRVHVIESGGRGGVFNHTIEVAAGLSAIGVDVVLHTSTDPEAAPADVTMCRCIRWHRSSRNRFVRRGLTTASYLGATLPHLWRAIGPDDVVHIQGLFALTPELISIARRRRATVVCSPHNIFVRDNAIGASRSLSHVLGRADRILVYADADVDALRPTSANVGKVPLLQWTPPADPVLVKRWREKLTHDCTRLALMPGQVRRDKNFEVFIEALALMPGWCGAIVGEDLGPGPDLDRLIERTGAPVTTHFQYIDGEDFVSLIEAADVVVAPYRIASQSAILAVAARLGVPSAAAPTGGLGEFATAVARDATPDAIRDAIIAACELGAVPSAPADGAARFLEEYVVAHERRRG